MEVDFLVKHLDRFLNTGQQLLTNTLNDSKHFDRLVNGVDELIGKQLSKVRQTLFW